MKRKKEKGKRKRKRKEKRKKKKKTLFQKEVQAPRRPRSVCNADNDDWPSPAPAPETHPCELAARMPRGGVFGFPQRRVSWYDVLTHRVVLLAVVTSVARPAGLDRYVVKGTMYEPRLLP